MLEGLVHQYSAAQPLEPAAWHWLCESYRLTVAMHQAQPTASVSADVATDKFGQDSDSAVEVGIEAFRSKTDNDGSVVELYAKIKKEGRPKTTLTPWIKNVRRKMKAIHA